MPSEYRSWGVLPGDWFIDAMMAHLQRPYYVALLSAARVHGASHQASQVFQVMTVTGAGAPRDGDLGRVRLRFYSSKHVGEDAVQRSVVATGYVAVSAKETTVVDLIAYHRVSGGYGNVATILGEIGELSGSELVRVASRRGAPHRMAAAACCQGRGPRRVPAWPSNAGADRRCADRSLQGFLLRAARGRLWSCRSRIQMRVRRSSTGPQRSTPLISSARFAKALECRLRSSPRPTSPASSMTPTPPSARSSVCSASVRTVIRLSRSVAQGLADRLNGALNRTVSDSRLSVEPIVGYPVEDAFLVARVVDGDYASLELDGTAVHLFAQQVVVVVGERCRTESYVYRVQADASEASWLMRWEWPSTQPAPTRRRHASGAKRLIGSPRSATGKSTAASLLASSSMVRPAPLTAWCRGDQLLPRHQLLPKPPNGTCRCSAMSDLALM